MKKIIKIVVVGLMTVLLLPFNMNTVHAASGSISVSGPSSLAPGETGYYTLTFNASETAYFSYSTLVSNGSAGGATASGAYGSGESKSESASISVTAGSSGTVVISVSGTAATTSGSDSEFSIKGYKEVSIVAPSSGGSSSGNGGSSGGSSGGSNQGGSEAPSKTPEELQAEAEQAEKERKEELAKSLLVESIDIVSSDTKLYGETLKTIKIEEGKTEYEYTLPKRVNKFLLDVASTSGDVTLTYDKEYEFKEDVKEHVITIRGVQEDVVKEYKLTLKQNLDEPTVVKMEDHDVTVYEDELLDRYMDKIGFKKTEIKIGDQKINGFGNDNLKAMLTLVDGEASWRLFNKDDEFLGDAVMMLRSEKEPFFIQSTTNGSDHEKVNKATYVDHTLELDKKILEIDPDLKFKETYKAWDLENESQLIYGVNAKGKQGFYNLDTEKNIEWSIVGFDHVDNAYVTATWGLSGALAVVSSGLIASILERKGLLKFKKK
ncbi:hypothetical protein [Erysipelothrix rhusiopathiae]|uniref:hypothetical protein n=1 Tax=Erysipelothrix rhusiopathiae TaxID=1648 RepID=UPI002B254C03|nr:hypothetical protein [Erysipelothrix rhusiopathiae]WRB92590.1 hypothetical protein LL063_06405 [Erysipelothrix rhusiopathiae]